MALEMKNSEILESGSELGSPEPNHDMHKSGFPDLSLSSGDSSFQVSTKEGEDSETSSLSTDSESEYYLSAINNSVSSSARTNGSVHQRRISDLAGDTLGIVKNIWLSEEADAENAKQMNGYGSVGGLDDKDGKYREEIRILNQKLQHSEVEIARLKGAVERSETAAVDMQVQLEAAQMEIKMKDVELENSKTRAIQLQNQIVELQTQISESSQKTGSLTKELELAREKLERSNEDIAILKASLDSEKLQVEKLQGKVFKYTSDVSYYDIKIKELQVSLSESEKKFSMEKENLLAQNSSLFDKQKQLEARLMEQESSCKSLEENLRQCETNKVAMKELHSVQQSNLQGEINQMKVALAERNDHVEGLNKDLDQLKLKYDMLMAAKDESNAQVDSLLAEASSMKNQILDMEKHLSCLNNEHARLVARAEDAEKLVDEMKLRVQELEKEVDGQKTLILDGAEKKREAIRQLCFSLEHYRTGYQELRQAILGSKRQAIAA